MLGKQEVEEAWAKLDPIFIMGMQRSGTSIMAIALLLAGFTGFGEGHLWLELIEPFSRFRDPSYRPAYKQDVFALGAGRNLLLEKYIAVAIDHFHRDNIPDEPVRWVDKSPGPEVIDMVPMLAQVFPKSQFVFMVRNGVSTVNSGLHLWHDRPNIFQTMCLGWVKTMSAWRRVRGEIAGRYIEIRQEDMASNPDGVATRLTDFLGVPECSNSVSDLLRSKRANSAFPNRSPGDYRYQINWHNEQKAYFIETCQEEMEAWGYEMEAADLRDTRIEELERKYQALREHFLRKVEQGRVMRLLNWIQKWKLRLLGKRSF